MSRDTHPGAQCPHCQSHLALVPVPGNSAAPAAPAAPAPAAPAPVPPAAPAPVPPAPAPKEDWQPPPVAEVLAVYAGRSRDSRTAMRGAAKVRESMNRAKAAAAQRKTAQKAARRTARSA